MMYPARELAWAYLARVAEGPCAPLATLIEQVGPEEAAHAIASNYPLPKVLENKVAARRHWNRAEEDLRCAQAKGFRLLSPDDPEWPTVPFFGFSSTGMVARQNRDYAAAAPYALWVKGDLSLLSCPTVAVVGSRQPSTYGERLTTTLAEGLIAEQVVLVSGLAQGIDAVAHSVSVQLHWPTVAVIANGCDQVYPSHHAALAHSIGSNGLIVSEYPPGTRPARYRFLARNRLLAALSEGVLVTSAAWRSGALNTATWGRDLGKPVMVCPHSVEDPDGAGCHRLLREGATCVTRVEDIVEELGPMGQIAMPLTHATEVTDALTHQENQVWNALCPLLLSTVGEVSAETALPEGEVNLICQELLSCKLVENVRGQWRRVAED